MRGSERGVRRSVIPRCVQTAMCLTSQEAGTPPTPIIVGGCTEGKC